MNDNSTPKYNVSLLNDTQSQLLDTIIKVTILSSIEIITNQIY